MLKWQMYKDHCAPDGLPVLCPSRAGAYHHLLHFPYLPKILIHNHAEFFRSKPASAIITISSIFWWRSGIKARKDCGYRLCREDWRYRGSDWTRQRVSGMAWTQPIRSKVILSLFDTVTVRRYFRHRSQLTLKIALAVTFLKIAIRYLFHDTTAQLFYG